MTTQLQLIIIIIIIIIITKKLAISPTSFSKNISNLTEIHSVRADSFHVDGRTHKIKLIVSFHLKKVVIFFSIPPIRLHDATITYQCNLTFFSPTYILIRSRDNFRGRITADRAFNSQNYPGFCTVFFARLLT